jgi:hypothetical protein
VLKASQSAAIKIKQLGRISNLAVTFASFYKRYERRQRGQENSPRRQETRTERHEKPRNEGKQESDRVSVATAAPSNCVIMLTLISGDSCPVTRGDVITRPFGAVIRNRRLENGRRMFTRQICYGDWA